MTKEEAEKKIQALVAEVNTRAEEMKRIADEYKIEFSVLGCTMHYYHRWYKGPADVGLFCSDEEWESSTFDCEQVYEWASGNFPGGEDDSGY